MEFTGERFVPSLNGQIKYEHLHRYAVSLRLAAGKSVLDVACGEGYGAALLAGVAKSVIGVDIEPKVIEHARSSYYNRNLKFLVGTCDSIPLPDASVEVVTSFETIEHHDKHEEMMLEIKRVLKPGGTLIISSPNRLTYSDEPQFVNEYHVKELYYDEFMELLNRHFSSTHCYGHRIAAGSFIFPLHESDIESYRVYSGDVRTLKEKVCALSAPVYFIAICSDRPVKNSLDSVYVDGNDDLFGAALTEQLQMHEAVYQERAVQMSSLATQVEQLSQQLSQKDALVQERDRQMAQSLEQVNVLNQQLEELTRRVSEKDALLEERNRQNAVSQAWSTEQLQELTRLVSEKEALLKERNRQDAETQAWSAEQLQELTRRVSEKEGLILEARQQVSHGLEKIDLLTIQLNEASRLASEKERQINENESLTERLSQQVDGLTGQTRKLEVLLGDRNIQLTDRSRQVEENQRKMQEQSGQLDGLTQALEQKERKLQLSALRLREFERSAKARQQDFEGSAKASQQDIANLRQDLVNLQLAYQATRDDFSNSGSYRIGRALSFPLRVVKRFLVAANGSVPTSVPKRLDRMSDSSGEQQLQNTAGTQDRYGNINSLDSAFQNTAEETEIVSLPAAAYVLFDADWYVSQNPDVVQGHVDPLQHYLRLGAREGRSPHPLFEPKFYLKNYPEAAIEGRNPLVHYLTQGWKKGYKPSPNFDPLFYVTTYPDIAEAGVEPLTHFVTEGLREGRVGCPADFSIETIEPFESEFEIPRTPTMDHSAFESDIKAIAFYLPQFHPIPENDTWWGTGFTEWTNVKRGRPQFKDHYQPHVPSILEYYDLREPDVLEKQVELARDYGIYGFCFYYYWFAGKVLLDLPIRRILETGKPDFPFCLCWANENWTRRWDGRESEILIAQEHSPDDDLAFLRNVLPVLLHKNYIRVDRKPMLIVYQPTLFPNAQATAARWREYFRAQGHGDLFLATMQTFADTTPPGEYGFDAVIQFPPHNNSSPVTSLVEEINEEFEGQVFDYNRAKWRFVDELSNLNASRKIFPGVMPSWDNTARRLNKSSVWINASPESYYDWLLQVSDVLRRTRPQNERLVFINAWNEWAEGCHLEPDQRLGYAWLNATRLALQSERGKS